MSDNQSAIRLILNPEYHQKTKHIDIQYHVIREHQANRNISVSYISTKDQIADIFTKALPPTSFLQLRQLLGVHRLQTLA